MVFAKPSDMAATLPDRRKLVAVVYADMVGYSRLIGLDDVGTLQRLRALRTKLIDPAIKEHGGRIVQTGGDSLLIVFDSRRSYSLCRECATASACNRWRSASSSGHPLPYRNQYR